MKAMFADRGRVERKKEERRDEKYNREAAARRKSQKEERIETLCQTLCQVKCKTQRQHFLAFIIYFQSFVWFFLHVQKRLLFFFFPLPICEGFVTLVFTSHEQFCFTYQL